MLDLAYWTAVGFVAGVVFASLFEWLLHRFVMHQPIRGLTYPFERHALIHHRIFKADETYHLTDEKDKTLIPMAWWNGPVLVALAASPFALVSWLSGHWGVLAGAVLACALYYVAYEYIHWCMHLPRKRVIERSGLFFRLNGHHLLHHRYVNRNYNVVLPLFDLLLGTLLLRSKVSFRQATGPCVPDVQPKERRLEALAAD